jgi:hypothetical protein
MPNLLSGSTLHIGFWASDRFNTCRKVPLQVNFLYDDILHCLPVVLSFNGLNEHKIFVHKSAKRLSWGQDRYQFFQKEMFMRKEVGIVR